MLVTNQASWFRNEALPSTVDPLSSIRLREPISQHMVGSSGVYRVTNVSKSRIWNPAQWKEMAEEKKWASPDFLGGKELGERSERSTVGTGVRQAGRRKSKAEVEVKGEDKGDEADGEEEEEDKAGPSTSQAVDPPTPSSPPIAATALAATVDDSADVKPTAEKKKRPTNIQRAEPTLEEWQTFMSTFEELPHGMKKEDYTIELLREVERRYWRTLTFGEPPMYGADMKGEFLLLSRSTSTDGMYLGSLFDDQTKAWNVASLGDLLPKLAPVSCKIPGVVSPYLYFGMWRATFAWHVEDADLYSINYIHFGAPKFWYAVPQELSERFERTMEGEFLPLLTCDLY
jgi:hypothetical protein